MIRWNPDEKTWEGDVPDGGAPPGGSAFIMLPGGVAQLFAPNLADGPFPEHYEPVESPIRNPLSSQQVNPTAVIWKTTEFDRLGSAEEFPIIASTYRVSEHWQTGAMSRNMPWLVGLMPDAFAEIARLGGGDKVRIDRAAELVPAMMHLTIEEAWWPAFDEFYALYLRLCR